MLKNSVVIKQSARFSMIVLLLFLVSPAYLGAEITEEKAIQSAHNAFSGDEPLLPEWTFYLDKKLERWHHTKSGWQIRSAREIQLGRKDTDFGPWLTQMESVLAGKHVWAVVYKRVLAPGERVFHPNAMVFVDADSGKVLAIISPEGAPLFPK